MILIFLIAVSSVCLCQRLRICISSGHPQLPDSGKKAFVKIKPCYNTGMAFGLFKINLTILTIVSGILLCCVIACIIWMYSVGGLTAFSVIGLGVFLGGGISNFFERIKFRRVFDYLNFSLGRIRLINRYVFNAADFFIFVGVIFIAVSIFTN